MKHSLVLLVCLSLAFGLRAEESDKNKPLDLIHADKLLSSGTDANNTTSLIGNVHLRHGTTELWSSRAIWYKKTDVVVFIDSVRLEDSLRVMTTKHLTYYRSTGSATAVGEVVIDDRLEKALLQANKVDLRKAENMFIATGGPVMTLYSNDDSAKTVIEGDSIIYHTDTKTGEAINNVRIKRRDTESTSQRADFFESGDIIKLSGDPIVTQGDNLLEGDQIELHTRNRTLKGMVVEGNAKATYRSRPDTLQDDFTEALLEGKQLEAYFANDKLDKAVMRRNATSYYTPAQSDTGAQGKNVASGDSITLFFDESEIYLVLILGGAEGHYVEDVVSQDTAAAPETTYYDAEEIDYLVKEKIIKLFDRSGLRYQNMALESGQIEYNIENEIMVAEGIVVQTDSGEVVEQTPVLREDNDELFGQRMAYNIRTRKGKVDLGKTEFDQGYYRGRQLRQVENNVLYVTAGEYTTCDLEHPHFHFYCHNMKMINKDKLIARPVILFIGPLPVFAFPYFVYPVRKGRHSGILKFEIGNFERGERFIRNVGYYWAASDYWDGLASLDYYENKSTVINSKINYRLRYNFSGYLATSFSRNTSWVNYERKIKDGWSVRYSHSQEISDNMSLNGGGTFISNKNYNLDNSYDQAERLERSVNAQANFRKSWKNESISIAADQTWNLDTDVKSRRIPTISFNRKSLPIFLAPSKKKKNERTLPWEEKPDENKDRWYHSIYFSINSKFVNFQQLNKKNEILDWTKHKTIHSTVALSSPQKILGILTVSPSANIQQTIYKIDQVHTADSVEVVTDGYFRREVWSTGVSMKTDLYGMVYPNIFHVIGLRHWMTPSVSYSYAPKTEKNGAYYEYTRVGSSSSRKKSMGFSLRNVFQMKVFSGGEEKKLDLFNLDFSTSYDFEKDEQRFSPLRSSLSTGALRLVNFSLSATHNFYDEITGKQQYFSPRLVNISASTSFSRKFSFGGEKKSEIDSIPGVEDELYKETLPGSGHRPNFESNKGTSLTASLSHQYSEQHSEGRVKSKTSKLQTGLGLALTAGWQIDADFQYDLVTKQTELPVFRLSRNLHCWAGEFIWRPTGYLEGYYFRIYIKQIDEIKIEQSVGGVRGY